MRPLSFVLALVFLIGGQPATHAPQTVLPGAGVFTYTGTPLVFEVSQHVAAVIPR